MLLTYGTYRSDFATHCWGTQKAFASRVGIPFLCLLIPPEPFATQRKLELLDKLAPKSGRVLYLDWDVEIAPDAENVFERNDRFCMFPHLPMDGPEPNAGMMLGDAGDFRALLPKYRVAFAGTPVGPLREQIATSHAAKILGLPVTEFSPRGFHHHVSPAKWHAFQSKYEYEPAAC